MKLEFTGQTARDESFPTGATSRLVNGYREPMAGRALHVLRAVPGMMTFADVPNVFARAATNYNGAIVAVVGDTLYRITTDGAVATLGDVEAADDIVSIDQNNGVVCVAANRKYWTWDGTTLNNPATGFVTDVGSVTQLGGYTLVSGYQSRIIQWSAPADPDTFDGLDFASAEITQEPIIRLVTFKDALFVFKESGFERWAVTGLAGPEAFTRIDGAQGEPGLLAHNLVTTFPNGMAWVGTDGRVHLLGVGPISTPALEVALAQEEPQRVFFYEQRGHGFICVTFRDIPAWCFDVATGEWHERSQEGGAWTARLSVKVGQTWYVGADNGQIARLGLQCLDFGAPMVRRFVSNTLEDAERFSVAKVEGFTRPAGDTQGDGTPAKVTLRTSRDGGMTWSAPKDREVGTAGAYEQRLVWRNLGQFRKAVVELSITSPTDIPMLSTLEVDLA